MATKKDLDRLRKEIAKQGFRVQRTKKNHYMVFRPIENAEADQPNKKDEGETVSWEFVTTLPSTPSEYKGLKNAKADLKRAGFVTR
ncbi:hypothetical protein [Streptomyces sp. NBC_01601]|uniref:hypothetical protein n=1 Tax=Streptomyces sp. NBC_01601 TaxID=2975892 RepID=UPI002E2D9C42|nr:hypothetical protein [Streptomyces sp. NBC_01601]